jgi:nitrogen-specific signal transduction histidine kinase
MLDQFKNANRLESKRVVSSTQIHELKNRLTVIKGISQLLGRQVRRPELQRDQLEERVTRLQDEVDRIRRDESQPVQHNRSSQRMAYSND